jgi:hypothetical protein
MEVTRQIMMHRREFDLKRLEESLHERAMEATGFSDFGDSGYRDGLSRLLSAASEVPGRDARVLDHVARAALRPLIGRLHSESGWRQHPECMSVALQGPVLITGMPRTGTTALHKLLALDQQFQVIERWLIPHPKVRPPRELWPSDPHYQLATQEQSVEEPEIGAAHHVSPDEPDECHELMSQTFAVKPFGSVAPTAHYDDWLAKQDMRPTYCRHANNLRLIGAEQPARIWLLKNPNNSHSIEAFLDVFPEAQVIQTHRHPLQAMTSLVSILAGIYDPLEGGNPCAVAEREVAWWADAMCSMDRARSLHPERFHDVDYRCFVTDPIDTVRQVYDDLGLLLSPSTAASMQRWLQINPPNKHGKHHYRADTGITPRLISMRFGEYIKRSRLD